MLKASEVVQHQGYGGANGWAPAGTRLPCRPLPATRRLTAWYPAHRQIRCWAFPGHCQLHHRAALALRSGSNILTYPNPLLNIYAPARSTRQIRFRRSISGGRGTAGTRRSWLRDPDGPGRHTSGHKAPERCLIQTTLLTRPFPPVGGLPTVRGALKTRVLATATPRALMPVLWQGTVVAASS